MEDFSFVDALAIGMISVSALALLGSLWIGKKTRALRESNRQSRCAREARYRAHKIPSRSAL